MLSVQNLGVSFGGKTLFEDISFLVQNSDRIGLVGKNGAGKSTLLKIIAGENKSYTGIISYPRDFSIGYLAQEMKHSNGKTVLEEASTAFEEINLLEKQISSLAHELTVRTDYETEEYLNVVTKLNDANERFAFLDGYNSSSQTERVLLGLGFTREDFNRQTQEFSGGWRMRIELGKILLKNPSLILLDEPTNHLDIESIQWLENFLQTYPGGLLMVSHDRDFLDRVTNRSIEIVSGKIYDYKANYSKFVQLREERIELQKNELKNQEKYIEHTEALINKYRAKANKASFAQSLIKKLDRLDRVEMDETENAAIRFKFPPAPHSGKVSLLGSGISKSFGTHQVLKDVDIEIERGEKIAFVGKNGQGKSTLVKIITGNLEAQGKITLGHQIKVGYYAQNQAEMLDEEKTVFATIDDVAEGEIRKQVRSLLGSFLFGGDEVEKKVKVLSGGEKSRLAMCKLLLQPYNLLILDEPTNHLDMRSKDMLKSALSMFEGTIIIVSHDRNFLHGLTDKIFEFKEGKVKPYLGDIYEFLKEKKIGSLEELSLNRKEEKIEIVKEKVLEEKKSYLDRKEEAKELKRLENKLKRTEDEIAQLEAKITSLDMEMAKTDFAERKDKESFFKNYEQAKNSLEKAYSLWEESGLELEEYKQKQ